MPDNFQSQTPFSEAGFSDIGMATEMFDILGVSQSTFNDPKEFSKLKDIADYFKGVNDATFVVESALRRKSNPSITPINHIWTYVQLRKQEAELGEKMSKLKKELDFYNG